MLTRIFKKNVSSDTEDKHPALERLSKLGFSSAMCTLVKTADGREISDEVGTVSFYQKEKRLFIRGRALYLAPPEGVLPGELPFSGQGEILNLQFFHGRTPYSLNCQVVQRVRFSDQLLHGMHPRSPVGFKLKPVGNVTKKENRQSLRFSHMRGVKGPQVFPNFRFDLFVERVQMNGPAHSRLPDVVPFPGDEPVPEEVLACASGEELVRFFHHTLVANPRSLQQVHISKAFRDPRSGAVELLDLGHTPVLGLRGEQKGMHLHLRCPRTVNPKDRSAPERLSEGDMVVLRFVGRSLVGRQDIHYRWVCRVYRCGIETLVLRPKGTIQKQTGLSVHVRDFSISGAGLQNTPLLETYLLGEEEIPEAVEDILQKLEGKHLLLHFFPRVSFPNDLEAYCPQVPASFSILGEIVRGRVDTGKDDGRINELGVAFRYDPADYGWEQVEIAAWEPIRGMRENLYFKEIHRALNSMLAFLEGKGHEGMAPRPEPRIRIKASQ